MFLRHNGGFLVTRLKEINKMKWIKYIGLLLMGCGSPTKVNIETAYDCGSRVGDTACNLELFDQNGDLWSLYDHQGKIMVIDFSTMWCGICNVIAPISEEIIDEYGKENVIWITILVEDFDKETVEQSDLIDWVDRYELTSSVLAGDRSLIDKTSTTGYNITGWPTVFTIDQSLTITHGWHGWSEEGVRQSIEENLNK